MKGKINFIYSLLLHLFPNAATFSQMQIGINNVIYSLYEQIQRKNPYKIPTLDRYLVKWGKHVDKMSQPVLFGHR